MKNYFKNIFAGFLLCLVIAILAQILARFLPQFGAALIAILLGIILGNTIFTNKIFSSGVRFSESKLLEFSIALTGLTLNLNDLIKVGGSGLSFIFLQMFFTIIFVYFLGKIFAFSKKFSLLMAAGNAVCGSSAIGTVAPILRANKKDKGLSITTVNLTGTFLMIALPFLSAFLYQHVTLQTSALIGGTLQSIGQVIASAKIINDPVLQLATIFKIIRIILLVLIALLFARMNTNDAEKEIFKTKSTKSKKRKVRIPWFIYAFFFFCCLVSFLPIFPELILAAKKISNQFEIIALAGIGMRVKFQDIKKEGPKALTFGLSIGIFQVLLAILLIYLLF